MKRLKIIFFSLIFVLFLTPSFVYAISTPELEQQRCQNGTVLNRKNICNIGTTDGLLFPNEWGFSTYSYQDQICPPGSPVTCKSGPKKYGYIFSYSTLNICSTDGCPGDQWGGTFGACVGTDKSNLQNVVNNSAFYNVFADNNNGIDGVLTNEKLGSLLASGGCPEYVYIGSSKSKQKLGFIFSNQKIDNAKSLLENAGFTVDFTQEGGEELDELAIKNYEDHVEKMKQNIQKFKDNDWGNKYSEECDKSHYFGIMEWSPGNTVIEYYEKYRLELFKINGTYDFSEGDKVLEEYKSMDCASESAAENFEDNSGPLVLKDLTCADLFKTENGKDYNNTWKLLNGTLKFMQYIAVIVALVLSIIDYIKVVPTNDKDGIIKATKKAAMRLGIAILIFFVPIILDFVLELIGFNDPTCGLI